MSVLTTLLAALRRARTAPQTHPGAVEPPARRRTAITTANVDGWYNTVADAVSRH